MERVKEPLTTVYGGADHEELLGYLARAERAAGTVGDLKPVS